MHIKYRGHRYLVVSSHKINLRKIVALVACGLEREMEDWDKMFDTMPNGRVGEDWMSDGRKFNKYPLKGIVRVDMVESECRLVRVLEFDAGERRCVDQAL